MNTVVIHPYIKPQGESIDFQICRTNYSDTKQNSSTFTASPHSERAFSQANRRVLVLVITHHSVFGKYDALLVQVQASNGRRVCG